MNDSSIGFIGLGNVGFTMNLVLKDVKFFQKLSKKFKIPAKISDLTVNIFQKGEKILGKQAFSTSIIKILKLNVEKIFVQKDFPHFSSIEKRKKME